LDYLTKVHERQEEWLKTLKDTPILTIDTGIYDIYNQDNQSEVKALIKNFIERLYF
jgi:deoxyadenosine/deoxycytidine kinase